MTHRYGISLGVSPREPLSRTSELARVVDDGGFEVLWYIDFQLGMKDVYAAMNLAAMSTKNVLIGPGVTNLVTRPPTVTANAMLRLAGETCDGVVLMGAADPEFCAWQLGFIHEGLAKAGRARDELTVDLFITMSVRDDEASAIDDVRAWATSQAATFHPWKRMPPAWERFRPDFSRAADAYHLVDHLSLQAEHKAIVTDEFARSVALAGDLDTCVDRLRRLWQLDIDRITFSLLSGGRMQRLAYLSDTVIGAVEATGEG